MSGISVRLPCQVTTTLVGWLLEFGFGNYAMKIDPRMSNTDLLPLPPMLGACF